MSSVGTTNNEDRLVKIREFYNAGYSLSRTARELSLSTTGLINWLSRHDPELLDAFRRRRTQELPAESREIHIHDVISYLSCRRAWDLGSPMRQNYTLLQPNKHLLLGSGIHYALQRYYDPEFFNHGQLIDPIEPFTEWFEKEKARIYSEVEVTVELEEMLATQYELGVGILKHYSMWAPEHDDFVVIGTELAFQVPLRSPTGRKFRPPVYYAGRIDKLIQDAHGKIWIAEFKTWSQIDLDRLKLEMQPSAYIWALRQQYDLEVEGVMYTILRKKVPRRPALLVSGELSRARNIDTTYEVYLDTIREHGLDPEDYQDVLEVLKEKGNTFFIREPVRRTKKEIEEFGERLYSIVREMLDPKLPIYPSPEPLKCRTCQFKPVCIALAEGQDVDFILQTQYKRRDTTDSFTVLDDALTDITLF